MSSIIFTQTAHNQLSSYKTGNQKLVFKVLDLIEEIQKTPFTGKGKPEALKHDLSGYWSRTKSSRRNPKKTNKKKPRLK